MLYIQIDSSKGCRSGPYYASWCLSPNITYCRADSRFAPSLWETALLCNDVSHWLGANLESALLLIPCPLPSPGHQHRQYQLLSISYWCITTCNIHFWLRNKTNFKCSCKCICIFFPYLDMCFKWTFFWFTKTTYQGTLQKCWPKSLIKATNSRIQKTRKIFLMKLIVV